MRYAISRYFMYRREMTYRIYVTDELYYSAHGNTHVRRWYESLQPPKKEKTGEEIAKEVIEKAGLIHNELI